MILVFLIWQAELAEKMREAGKVTFEALVGDGLNSFMTGLGGSGLLSYIPCTADVRSKSFESFQKSFPCFKKAATVAPDRNALVLTFRQSGGGLAGPGCGYRRQGERGLHRVARARAACHRCCGISLPA